MSPKAIRLTLGRDVQPDVKRAFQMLVDHINNGISLSAADIATLLAGYGGGYGGGGTGTGGDGDPDLTVPDQPQNLTVTGGFNVIFLQWDQSTHSNIAYTEIWRSEADNLEDLGTTETDAPIRIGTTLATVYADIPPDASLAQTYYYWVRFVSTANIVGPFNATAGTPGSTADDPAYLLEVLAGEITATQLHSSLTTTISTLESDVDTLQAEVATLTNLPDYAADTDYAEDDMVKYDGGIYVAIQDVLNATVHDPDKDPTDTAYWTKIGDYASLGDAVAALAIAVDDLDTQVTVIDGELTAEVAARQLLATTVGNNTTAISTETTLRTNADTALGTSISTLTARVDVNEDDIDANWSAIQTELGVLADADSAEAWARQQVEAVVYDQTSGVLANHAAVQTNAQAIVDGDALAYAEYTIKLNANDKVAGIGLMVTDGASGPISSLVEILADVFAIAHPDPPAFSTSTVYYLGDMFIYNGVVYSVTAQGAAQSQPNATPPNATYYDADASLMPFIVKGGRVYMDTVIIEDASITDAHVGELTADHITSGTITNTISIISPYLASGLATPSVVFDLANQYLRMGLTSGNYVYITPGTAAFYKAGSAQPLFEFNGSSIIMRDASGNVMFQSGTGMNAQYVAGLGFLATEDYISLTSGRITDLSLGNLDSSANTRLYSIADGATRNYIFRQASAPASPANGDIWVDIDATPVVTYVRVSGSWQVAATDGASWSGVYNDGGKPADNATRNTVYRQPGYPSNPATGDIWVDTDAVPQVTYTLIGGIWQVMATNGAKWGDNFYGTGGNLVQLDWFVATWNKITGDPNGNVLNFMESAAIPTLMAGVAYIYTANIVNANVTTLNVGGNAVTVPSGAATTYGGSVSTGWQTIVSVTVDSTIYGITGASTGVAAPVAIFATVEGILYSSGGEGYVEFKVENTTNSVDVFPVKPLTQAYDSLKMQNACAYYSPSTGSKTYALRCRKVVTSGNPSAYVYQANIVVMGLKR